MFYSRANMNILFIIFVTLQLSLLSKLVVAENNSCIPNPCKNGGVCVSKLQDGFSCSCVNGYTGDRCDDDFNECLSRPCSAGASGCINGRNRFNCTCLVGYSGVTCQTARVSPKVPPCTTSKCPRNSECKRRNEWEKYNVCCENTTNACFDADECHSDPCEGSKPICVDQVNSYYCKEDADQCASNPCAVTRHSSVHSPVCVDQVGSYYCKGQNRECDPHRCTCAAWYFPGAFCREWNSTWAHIACSLRERYAGGWMPECGISKGKCPYIGYHYSNTTGKCYAFNSIKMNWHAAQDYCRLDFGAELIQLTNDIEFDFAVMWYWHFLWEYFEPTWIGLTDTVEEGIFRWTGLYPNITYWPSEQTGLFGNSRKKNCVQFLLNSPWLLASCTELKVSLCETARLCKHSNCPRESVCKRRNALDKYQMCCVTSTTDVCLDADECESNPCNGSKPICVDQVNSYYCTRLCKYANCPPESECKRLDSSDKYKVCCATRQTDVCLDEDECESNPCEGSKPICVDQVNSYYCKEDVDQCESNPCNGSKPVCVDQVNSYYCKEDVNECASSPCAGGDSCTDKVNGYECGNLDFNIKSGATNQQQRGGITSLLSVCAILWVFYDQTAIISLCMM